MVKKSSPTSTSMPVRIWLRDAAEMLASAGIPSALLDAEIILAHTLRKSRTWLHAHSDDSISLRELEIANARLDLRLDRTPIAYIIGHKEFYGRRFLVSPSVLIPRPESETLITLLQGLTLQNYNSLEEKTEAKKRRVVLFDVGTGSGCLGITAKLEHPELHVFLIDISRHALVVAQKNADILRADVSIVTNDLLTPHSGLPAHTDIIVANLPYVDREWERSPETRHEPSIALFADRHGLALIDKLLQQSASYLSPAGHLVLEADPSQHHHIIEKARLFGYEHRATDGYCIVFSYR